MTMGWVTGRSTRTGTPGPARTVTVTRRRRGPHSRPRTVPASVIAGTELLHIGGGETLPCPDAGRLPLTRAALDAGLGTARLALPPVRLHVLSDVVVHPGSRVVTTTDGMIVAESLATTMDSRVALDAKELRSEPIHMDGTVAVFQGPLRSTFHTLLADLPRAGLLIHPVVSRLGTVRLLHGGPLSDVEAPLLAHLGSRRVELVEVEPGRPVHADRVVLPGHATRTDVGAVPSWYRRWADAVALPPTENAPRRVFLDDAAGSGRVRERGEVLEMLEARGVGVVDPSRTDPAVLFGILRDAELVVGASRDALAGCLFSRRAHVIELSDAATVDPAIYYLAASKGLPYDVVTSPSASSRHGEPVLDLATLDRLLERRSG